MVRSATDHRVVGNVLSGNSFNTRAVRVTGLALGLIWQATFAAQVVGPNLVTNPGFEVTGANGRPSGWRFSDHPPGCAQVGTDDKVVLTGRRSVKLALPDQGSMALESGRAPVEGGKAYLFSIGFRSEGFGNRGYQGIDAHTTFRWWGADGKQRGRSGGVPFPYTPSDWDLRDCFVRAPAGATGVNIVVRFSNRSRKHTKRNVPSVLWLDAAQLRRYTPPPSPAWATRKVERIVEGAPDTRPVRSYHLAAQRSVGGKWSKIVADPDSTHGTAIASPAGAGRGIMCHSAYFTGARPGLYRAVLRCKVTDIRRKESPGYLDVDSQFASIRALLRLWPSQFAVAETYQDFSVDFFLRTPGYWDFRLYTDGNQTFTADTVRVFPLAFLSDRQLLDIYPGSDGTVPAGLKPKRAGPLSVLLVAGLMYDYWGIESAVRLTGLRAELACVWVSKGRSQRFQEFPGTPEDLFRFDLICLCNVDVTCLTLRRKRMIVEYVRRGGGLVVLGGHQSLDRGGMGGSLLDDVLPVACPRQTVQPLVHFPTGAPLLKSDDHPVTRSLDGSAGPRCFWMHDVPARPGAATLLHVAGKPAVVVGRFGRGRVACVLLTCMGDPAPGKMPFWQWAGWVVLLRDLCRWTAGWDMPDVGGRH